MIYNRNMIEGIIVSVLLAREDHLRIGQITEEPMHDATRHLPRQIGGDQTGRHFSSVLYLPDPASLESRGAPTAAERKYQLSLRVDEGTYRYLIDLSHEAEAETISELVRMSLRALEDALHKYEEVHRSDGLVVSLHQPARFEGENCLATLRPTPTRRINVVLREAAHQRVERLLSELKGLTLVDIVMTAVGIVDADVRNRKSETGSECVSSDSVSDSSGCDDLTADSKSEREVA
jgi:hypothetical protein